MAEWRTDDTEESVWKTDLEEFYDRLLQKADQGKLSFREAERFFPQEVIARNRNQEQTKEV